MWWTRTHPGLHSDSAQSVSDRWSDYFVVAAAHNQLYSLVFHYSGFPLSELGRVP